MISNNMIGVGKGKKKYCTIEEFKKANLRIDNIGITVGSSHNASGSPVGQERNKNQNKHPAYKN